MISASGGGIAQVFIDLSNPFPLIRKPQAVVRFHSRAQWRTMPVIVVGSRWVNGLCKLTVRLLMPAEGYHMYELFRLLRDRKTQGTFQC